MKDTIRTRIREHIVETWLNGDARGFDDDADLQRTGVLDSFTTLSLASFLDETFLVQLDPIDINTESFRTVNTVADLVLEKLAAKRAAAAP
ncbi:MAG: acyl carrier protein [Polyangiales bacterium]